ncbi:MAG: DUF1517 domain-containing protein [Cyanobacteria bacterium J06632_19]
MRKKLQSAIKPLLKPFLVVFLVFTLVFSQAPGALAARSGGRIGGGSFRMPSSRPYSSPRTYAPSRGGYAPYPGGGFGFPFLFPFWGIGGGFGGLFGILIFFALANFLVNTFRRVASDGGEEFSGYSSNPTISVTRLQVGLLAQARELQTELNHLAETADTQSSQGRAQVLQEASLALMRHPEYWVYAGGNTNQARLNSAEAEFNRLSLAERSKFSEETLTNVNSQLKAAISNNDLQSTRELDNPTDLINQGPGEYIVVTLLAATLGKTEIPNINNSDDLRQALSQFGGIPSDKLVAFEILWTPQADGDTLTSDDLLAEYSDLKLV